MTAPKKPAGETPTTTTPKAEPKADKLTPSEAILLIRRLLADYGREEVVRLVEALTA